MSVRVLLRISLVTALSSQGVFAQFDNQWARFAPATGAIRDTSGNAAGYVTGDVQEKDFAWGDLDQDGWTDLVMVRKQPFTTTGAYPNFLLRNEGGLLVDRSAQYASQTDIAGDDGFLTATNDRDVELSDVNLDGWLDVITCTAMSDGQPKHISHPRIYVNLGNDANGNWLGLRFEDARIPTMTPTPRFCGVAAGDVTGDGAPDLYFADYGSLEDRLLINDGNGFFTDSVYSRMPAAMLSSGFGTAAYIVDMNGDGHNDIVRSQATAVSLAHNDPANVGHFPSTYYQSQLGGSATYHTDVGDLNNDGRPDLITADDGSDLYRINTGTLPNGTTSWGPHTYYQFLTGSDDGFGGSLHIADLDGDGWNEVIVADVDVDIPGCGRRAHIYHNLGGTPGGTPILREEAQQPSGGWRGVHGMLAADLTGTHDVAIFDLDNDGDLDMVFGRCSGTFVWMNQASTCPTVPYAYGEAVPNSTGVAATMGMTGSASLSASDLVLTGEGLPANKTALFLYGTARLWSPAPFGNGLRFIAGTLQRLPPLTTTATGTASYAADFSTLPLSTVAPGTVHDFQLWFRDPEAGGANFNASSALEIVFCP